MFTPAASATWPLRSSRAHRCSPACAVPASPGASSTGLVRPCPPRCPGRRLPAGVTVKVKNEQQPFSRSTRSRTAPRSRRHRQLQAQAQRLAAGSAGRPLGEQRVPLGDPQGPLLGGQRAGLRSPTPVTHRDHSRRRVPGCVGTSPTVNLYLGTGCKPCAGGHGPDGAHRIHAPLVCRDRTVRSPEQTPCLSSELTVVGTPPFRGGGPTGCHVKTEIARMIGSEMTEASVIGMEWVLIVPSWRTPAVTGTSRRSCWTRGARRSRT